MGAPELQENMRIDRIEENSFIFTLRTRQDTHRESELRYWAAIVEITAAALAVVYFQFASAT